MSVSNWTESDTAEAKRIWTEFRKDHDVSDRLGQTVGIDPGSGHLWFGNSISDVIAQRDADGIDSALFFERVGSETYWRKGGQPIFLRSLSPRRTKANEFRYDRGVASR